MFNNTQFARAIASRQRMLKEDIRIERLPVSPERGSIRPQIDGFNPEVVTEDLFCAFCTKDHCKGAVLMSGREGIVVCDAECAMKFGNRERGINALIRSNR